MLRLLIFKDSQEKVPTFQNSKHLIELLLSLGLRFVSTENESKSTLRNSLVFNYPKKF